MTDWGDRWVMWRMRYFPFRCYTYERSTGWDDWSTRYWVWRGRKFWTKKR